MAFEINGKIEKKALLHYVPHGINSEIFKPLPTYDERLTKRRFEFLQGRDYNFVIFFNSRNTHRKRASNIILAYRTFCDNLPKEKAEKCCLLMHTEIKCDQGTDLLAVKEALCPNYNIIFSTAKIQPEDMNCLYNIADITVNISSNEGFGLSGAESIMCGTPTVINVTGGLQDQIGQTDDNGKPIEFDLKFGTNSGGKYKNHGVWVKPVYPSARYIQGSIPTPYIFDDLCDWEDVSEAFMYWYLMDPKKREECGLKGREWAMNEGGLNAKNMCDQFIKAMDYTLENWRPEDPVDLVTYKDYVGNELPDNNMGIEIPKIDINKVQNEVNKTVDKLNVK